MVFIPKPEKCKMDENTKIVSSLMLQSSKAMNYPLMAGLLTTPEVSSSHLCLGKNSDLECTSFLVYPVEITAAGLFRIQTEFPFNFRRYPKNQ
jgi:hypothetical protein